MRYQYVVTLKRESERATNLLSFFMCLLSGIAFLFAAFRDEKIFWLLLPLGILLIIGAIFQDISTRRGRRGIQYRYLLVLSALGWIGMPVLPWLGVFFVILAFLEYQTKRPLEIGFDSDRVVINTLIRRQYDWSAFSNVVLRDGLLTIDFKNNRLLQKEVQDDEEDEDDADEQEFNDYCRSRLAAVALIK
jgi:hypothetical protein